MTDPKPDTPSGEDAEKAFWDKFTSNLDGWWDAKVKAYQEEAKKNPPGTSRTGKPRVTLPGLIADIVFGPEKD